jgi:protein-tyrosine-phosphatase
LDFQDFDFVVAMNKYVAKKLKDIPPSKLLWWNIDDPYGDNLEEYRLALLDRSEGVTYPFNQLNKIRKIC